MRIMLLVTSILVVAAVKQAILKVQATGGQNAASHSNAGCCLSCLPGRDGRDGRDGIQGPYGPPGPPGEKGSPAQSLSVESQVEGIINTLTVKMSALITEEITRHRNSGAIYKSVEGSTRSDSSFRGDSVKTGMGGAVYTRWGRTTCPTHSITLYNGVMAGSFYNQKGSGVNHLCLPLNPQWNKTYPGFQSDSFVYGTEFQLSAKNDVLMRSNSGGVSFHDREALCAVCYTPGRPSHVMIPARLECPSGWTVEYLGFLMAEHHTHYRSEYVCVDQAPDTHPGTGANLDGNLLYLVEAKCGSLPCPNYVDGYEVTCVVCTR